MVASVKDHRGAVNCIMVSPKTGAEAISASSDGCCIIWDLETMKRRTSFLANTFFKSVAFHPDESQVWHSGCGVGLVAIQTQHALALSIY